MRGSFVRGAGIVAAACLTPVAFGQADVITGELRGPGNPGGEGPRYWGNTGSTLAYSVGTTSCNIGTVPLLWFDNSSNHPVMTNNFFRIMDGRIEQVGIGWCKHGFCALQQPVCGSCTPTGGGCEATLGVGCSDPYSSFLNGLQDGIGPRSDINPANGAFSWPYSTINQTGNTIYKRIQVAQADLNPALNGGAVYLAEGQYVAPDDAAADNDNNNASYRYFTVGGSTGSGWHLNWDGGTVREDPAIFAWPDTVSGVTLVAIDSPGDGRYWLGYRVTDNGDGTWHYEYALQNLTSHRAAGGFMVGVGDGATVTNVTFKDIDYHSGEPYDPTDWGSTVGRGVGGFVSWDTTGIGGSNANALRWGTLYNFAFDADTPPVSGTATVDLFTSSPPLPDSVAATVMVPDASDGPCGPADLAEPYGSHDFFDVLEFLDLFDSMDSAADLAAPFGAWDFFDVLEFLSLFDEGCP